MRYFAVSAWKPPEFGRPEKTSGGFGKSEESGNEGQRMIFASPGVKRQRAKLYEVITNS